MGNIEFNNLWRQVEEKALVEGSLSEKLMEEYMDTVRDQVITIAKTHPQRGQAKDTYKKNHPTNLNIAQHGLMDMPIPRGSGMGNMGYSYQQENPYESYYSNNSMMGGGGYSESNMMGYQVWPLPQYTFLPKFIFMSAWQIANNHSS